MSVSNGDENAIFIRLDDLGRRWGGKSKPTLRRMAKRNEFKLVKVGHHACATMSSVLEFERRITAEGTAKPRGRRGPVAA